MSDTDSLENDLKRFSSCSSTAFDHFQQGKQEGLSDGPLQSGTSSATQTSSAHSSGTRPLIGSTIDIERIYALISPTYSSGPKLKHRILTVPPNGVSNDNNDNEDGNLICRVYDVLKSTGNKSYTILETLGTGTFGQVFRCQRDGTKDMVAVKIIKNKSAYHRQGTIEIAILKQLNKECERKDHHGVVKLIDSFEHKQHICIVFELLQMSLLDVLTQNHFRGLPIHIVQRFTKQILQAMCLIEQANIIHCDIKPENILLSNIPSVLQEEVNNDNGNATEPITTSIGNEGGDKESTAKDRNELHSSGKSPGVGTLGDIKVIDFGSACFEGKTAYSYIQSRFYRSPEVLLGIPYNGAIDLWSLACVCAEMFLGLPLFPGVSQHNQLGRIVEMLGMPPDIFIETKQGLKYFTRKDINAVDKDGNNDTAKEGSKHNPHPPQESSKFRLKTAEEYAAETNTEVPTIKKYLRYNQLDEIIMKCPLANKSKLTTEQKQTEMKERESFLDFLRGLFRLNPFERWTSKQAYQHPFIQGTPLYACPGGEYVPMVDSRVNERKLNFMLFMQKRGYGGPGLVRICKSSSSSSTTSTAKPNSTSTVSNVVTSRNTKEQDKGVSTPPRKDNSTNDTAKSITNTSSSMDRREQRKQRNSPNTKTFQSRISSTYGGSDMPAVQGRKKGGISNNVEALERAKASGDSINVIPDKPPKLVRGQAVKPELSSHRDEQSIDLNIPYRKNTDKKDMRDDGIPPIGGGSSVGQQRKQGAQPGVMYAPPSQYGSLPAHYQYYSTTDQHGNVTYYATPSYADPGQYAQAHPGQHPVHSQNSQPQYAHGSSMEGQLGAYMYGAYPPAAPGSSVGGQGVGMQGVQYGSPITHGGMYIPDPAGHPMHSAGSYRPSQQIFAFSPLSGTPVYPTVQGTSPGTSPMSYGASYGTYMTELGHAMIRPGVDESRQITSGYVQVGNQLVPAATTIEGSYMGVAHQGGNYQPPYTHASRDSGSINRPQGRDRGGRGYRRGSAGTSSTEDAITADNGQDGNSATGSNDDEAEPFGNFEV